MEKYYMNEALKLAVQAFNEDEIPVGAVVVRDNKIISQGDTLASLIIQSEAKR